MFTFRDLQIELFYSTLEPCTAVLSFPPMSLYGHFFAPLVSCSRLPYFHFFLLVEDIYIQGKIPYFAIEHLSELEMQLKDTLRLCKSTASLYEGQFPIPC